MITAAAEHSLERLCGRLSLPDELVIKIDTLHITQLANRRKRRVGHSQLLPLVDKRRALQGHLKHGKQFCNFTAIGAVRIDFRDHARMVVIFKKDSRPAVISVLHLPFHQVLRHGAQVEPVVLEALLAWIVHMIKGEDNVQLSPVVPRHQAAHLEPRPLAFAYCKGIELSKGILPQFSQILMQMRTVKIVLAAFEAHQGADDPVSIR